MSAKNGELVCNNVVGDERLFGFLRVTSGDELSKRAKFVFLTWIGDGVSALKRAKVSTDKASVKNLWQVCNL